MVYHKSFWHFCQLEIIDWVSASFVNIEGVSYKGQSRYLTELSTDLARSQ
jgi:hypothetical protein